MLRIVSFPIPSQEQFGLGIGRKREKGRGKTVMPNFLPHLIPPITQQNSHNRTFLSLSFFLCTAIDTTANNDNGGYCRRKRRGGERKKERKSNRTKKKKRKNFFSLLKTKTQKHTSDKITRCTKNEDKPQERKKKPQKHKSFTMVT